MSDYSYFEVKFETASEISPPLCHYYHLIAEFKNETSAVSFDWTYHNREDLTQQEIEEEGFLGEADNFSWQGSLNKNLTQVIIDKLQKVRLLSEESLKDHENYIEIVFKKKDEQFSGFPQEKETWEYFLQEIIQGIYEISGKEKPLEITYLNNEPEISLKTACKVSFATRNAVFTHFQHKTRQSEREITDWQAVQHLVNMVFSLNLSPDKSSKKFPMANGFFLNIGDETWYVISKKEAQVLDKLFLE